jgi:hypothetical protein
MRNRAVELHLSSATSPMPLVCKPLAGESAMTRFRVVGRHASQCDSTTKAQDGLLRDHLAFSDRSATEHFTQQIDRSLFLGNFSKSEAGTNGFSDNGSGGDEAVLSQIQFFHQENARMMDLPFDFINAQVSDNSSRAPFSS